MKTSISLLVTLVCVVGSGCGSPPPAAKQDDTKADPAPKDPGTNDSDAQTAKTPEPPQVEWTSLFDGKQLGKWKVTDFGGQGEVSVEDGRILMGYGSNITGITWSGELPRQNYEVSLEARREDGIDFFCGLTFPVGDDPCSFIVAGWGGAVVGLSSINELDASENETTRNMSFKNGRWYKIRVRVEEKRIQCWIDDERVVNVDTTGKKISIRPEMDLSRPLGIAGFQTIVGLREIKLRKLD